MKLRLACLVVTLACMGCAGGKPIHLMQSYIPPSVLRWEPVSGKAPKTCEIAIDTVKDMRADANSMGSLGARIVSLSDTAAWVRSGFETMKQDKRIQFVSVDRATAALGLSVELLKAYTSQVNTEIVSSVVVRVRYEFEGVSAGEVVLRGADNTINWASGDSEVQASLNRALHEIVVAADKDILTRCAEAKPLAA